MKSIFKNINYLYILRVATAQGKQGIWFLLFPDGKHREFCCDTGKNLLTQGKYLDCDY